MNIKKYKHFSDTYINFGMEQPLGSHTWIGAEVYQDDNPSLYHGTKMFFEGVNWEYLAFRAATIRCEECSWEENERFYAGRFNIVRRLKFKGGVCWIAKVRLPSHVTPEPGEALNRERAFEYEVGGTECWKTMDNMPVPEIFDYDFDYNDRKAGPPYILMEYVHGTVASKLRIQSSRPHQYGTDVQDQMFREQMANIQVRMSTLRFSRIGGFRMARNDDTNDYKVVIDGDLEMGKREWASSRHYHKDLAEYLFGRTVDRYYRKKEKTPPIAFPSLLATLLVRFGSPENEYRSTIRGFGEDNVLVNNDFKVIGVIGTDDSMCVPDEAIPLYPDLEGHRIGLWCSLLPEPSLVKAREASNPRLGEYKQMIFDWESKLVIDKSDRLFSSRVDHLPAIVFRTLLKYDEYKQPLRDELSRLVFDRLTMDVEPE